MRLKNISRDNNDRNCVGSSLDWFLLYCIYCFTIRLYSASNRKRKKVGKISGGEEGGICAPLDPMHLLGSEDQQPPEPLRNIFEKKHSWSAF